ncbi:hypothetical protein D915_007403 [Fasciola hepatica]|uniref:Uncharacterized protein n=1 Tax=Fasciola hepatica TaxID=6192 RepID=A0A4E0R352_FASHE|nr:hypothetical protein D915_007403 [Fasciola hepatica]
MRSRRQDRNSNYHEVARQRRNIGGNETTTVLMITESKDKLTICQTIKAYSLNPEVTANGDNVKDHIALLNKPETKETATGTDGRNKPEIWDLWQHIQDHERKYEVVVDEH